VKIDSELDDLDDQRLYLLMGATFFTVRDLVQI
jgi:hypothetical protein